MQLRGPVHVNLTHHNAQYRAGQIILPLPFITHQLGLIHEPADTLAVFARPEGEMLSKRAIGRALIEGPRGVGEGPPERVSIGKPQIGEARFLPER